MGLDDDGSTYVQHVNLGKAYRDCAKQKCYLPLNPKFLQFQLDALLWIICISFMHESCDRILVDV